jgi:cytidylate kinase
VRHRLVELQRAAAAIHGGVLEGRDIGTRVLPDTPYKFFVDAAPAVRVERRWRQLAEAGQVVDRDSVERELAERDWRDTHREESPLRCDDSYVRVDTSALAIDQVVEAMALEVERRRSHRGSQTAPATA